MHFFSSSISGESARRPDVKRMGEWLEAQLKQYGVETRQVDLGTQHIKETGETLPLPPAILGRLGHEAGKKTILIYGHYDVQPVRVLLY
jgi:Cys-Gly metallodipeptidase DUG1